MADKSETIKLSDVEILSIFKSNVVDCLDNLLEIFTDGKDQQDLITFKVGFELFPITLTMKLFSDKILPLGTMIRKRNDEFFLDDTKNFKLKIGDTEISWKSMWKSRKLEQDDKTRLWEYMTLFLNLAEMYRRHVAPP